MSWDWKQTFNDKDIHGNTVLAVYCHHTNDNFACYVYKTSVGTVFSSDDRSLLVAKIKEKKYRPYTMDEIRRLRTKEHVWFLSKGSGIERMMTRIGDGVLFMEGDDWLEPTELMEEYVHLDKAVAGVLE